MLVIIVILLVFLGLGHPGCQPATRGIPCVVCGKTAVYEPGATTEGLRYVCPEGHVTRSNRLVR